MSVILPNAAERAEYSGEEVVDNRYVEPPHIDDPSCWCFPEIVYIDPETDDIVWKHHYAQ